MKPVSSKLLYRHVCQLVIDISGSPGKPCVRKWSGIDATEPEKEIPDI